MIKIGFVGDIFPGGCWALKDGLTNEVISLFKPLDLRVANLETAFGDGSIQCHIKMSDPKLGNTLFCPDHCIEVLKKLNINVVSLANNHACDCDLQGLAHTIELLDKNGIKHFGAGRNKEEVEKPAIVEIKEKKIGFLGYFPPEWEAPYPPTETKGGLNQFYIDKVLDDVRSLKSQCDYVFVMPHWGWEYTICPRAIDVINAKKIIEAGATGVLGAHTHTVQPIIKYKGSVMAIGLGNFIFPDRYIKPPRQTCYPSKIDIDSKKIPFTTKFNIVDKLTVTGMPPKCRIGILCEVFLEEDHLGIHKVYTRMSSANVLQKKGAGIITKIKLWLVGLLLTDSHSVLYRIFYNRIRNYYHRVLDKMHIHHPM